MTTMLAERPETTKPQQWWQRVESDPREFKRVPIADLVIDSAEQRNTPPERVDHIVTHFDWRKVEVPTVAHIPGTRRFRVIEGQTRVLAFKQLDPDGQLMCAVIPDTSTQDRAALALGISTSRRGFSAFDKWKQRVRAGGEHELAVEAVLSRLGLRMGPTPGKNVVGCPAAITELIHTNRRTPAESAELLDETLAVLTTAYNESDPNSLVPRFDRDLIRAVWAILIRNSGRVDIRRLALHLASRSAEIWLRDASVGARERKYMIIGSAIVREYNKRLADPKRLVWS